MKQVSKPGTRRSSEHGHRMMPVGVEHGPLSREYEGAAPVEEERLALHGRTQHARAALIRRHANHGPRSRVTHRGHTVDAAVGNLHPSEPIRAGEKEGRDDGGAELR
jgi:hypothetical protein